MKIHTSILITTFITCAFVSSAQDSLKTKYTLQDKKKFLQVKSVIIPSAFLLYGFTSLDNPSMQGLNKQIRTGVMNYNTPFKTRIDDYLRYAPAVAVYALDFAGIKSKHNFIDRTIIYFVASTLTKSLSTKIKYATGQLRPDGSTYNSFPSGHTATAFTGAEFMNQEYGERSIWYSVAGYTTAAATGTFRIMNNRHWLSDVIAGAGLGILSTKFTYWLYYKVKPALRKKKVLY